ncbi:alanine racemase, partial [Nocardioides hankookensis]
MSLTLTIDGDRWRAHLRSIADAEPGLVPVAKGNGYGFTLGRLARKAQWLGVDTVPVGTYEELSEVASRYDGSLLVLTPWRPFGAATELDPALARRVIHTVSRIADLGDLLGRQPDARVVLERSTSMLRHGMTARELWSTAEVVRDHPKARVAGVALHLPLANGAHLSEVHRLMTEVVATELPLDTVWVSHLSSAELSALRTAYPDFTFRPRIGTNLWLGDRSALHVTATVLDVHEVERGDGFGYRHRTAPKAGHVLVVSGGTALGIG